MLTAKQEQFCQNIISGMSGAGAYRESYKCEKAKDTVVYVRASELMRKPQIAARIEVLGQEIAEKSAITVLDLIGELEEARAQAMSAGQTSAAVSAIMGKAKLLGFGAENVNVKTPKVELVQFVD